MPYLPFFVTGRDSTPRLKNVFIGVRATKKIIRVRHMLWGIMARLVHKQQGVPTFLRDLPFIVFIQENLTHFSPLFPPNNDETSMHLSS